jgi:hypothetical protein
MRALPDTQQSADLDSEARNLISKILHNCGRKRAEVAREMGISITLLDAYCSTSMRCADKNRKGEKANVRRVKFPAALIPAFSRATGSDALQVFVLSKRQRRLLELGELADRLVSKARRRKQP